MIASDEGLSTNIVASLDGDESGPVLDNKEFTTLQQNISQNSLKIVTILERQSYSSARFLEFMDLMMEALYGDLHAEIRGEGGYVFNIYYLKDLLRDFHSAYQEIKAT